MSARNFLLTASLTAAALLAPSSALAADTSWDTTRDDKVSIVADAGYLAAVRLDPNGCGPNKDRIMFRQRTGSGWTAWKGISRCTNATLAQPAITRDPRNHKVFAVWSETNITSKKKSGVYVAVARNGRTFSAPKQVVSTPTLLSPATVAVAARATRNTERLYIMRQLPKSYADTSPKFVLEGYHQKTFKLTKKNMAKGGRAIYRANSSARSMSLYAGNLGLVATWTLSQGGKKRVFAADTEWRGDSLTAEKRLRLRFAGDITANITGGLSGTALTNFIVGEDRRPYMFVEHRTSASNGLPQFIVRALRWSWVSHRFYAAIPGHEKIASGFGTFSGNNVIAGQVTADRRVLVAYLNVTSSQSCLTVSGAVCTETTAPTPAAPIVQVLSVGRDGSRQVADMAFPFAPAAPAGAQVSEWWQPGEGLDRITTSFGGTRLLYLGGHQDNGTAGLDGKYNLVLSGPLSFRPFTSPWPN